MAERGDSLDPDTKAKLDGLQDMLGGLGVNLKELTGDGSRNKNAEGELRHFLLSCVKMSVERLGVRSSVLHPLRLFADGKMPKEEAANSEVFKHIGVCASDLT